MLNSLFVGAKIGRFFERIGAAYMRKHVLMSVDLLQRNLAQTLVYFKRNQICIVHCIGNAFIVVVSNLIFMFMDL